MVDTVQLRAVRCWSQDGAVLQRTSYKMAPCEITGLHLYCCDGCNESGGYSHILSRKRDDRAVLMHHRLGRYVISDYHSPCPRKEAGPTPSLQMAKNTAIPQLFYEVYNEPPPRCFMVEELKAVFRTVIHLFAIRPRHSGICVTRLSQMVNRLPSTLYRCPTAVYTYITL